MLTVEENARKLKNDISSEILTDVLGRNYLSGTNHFLFSNQIAFMVQKAYMKGAKFVIEEILKTIDENPRSFKKAVIQRLDEITGGELKNENK